MTPEEIAAKAAADKAAAQAAAAQAAASAAAAQPDLIALEEKRISDVKKLANLYGLGDDFVTEQISLSANLDKPQANLEAVRTAALKRLAEKKTAIPGTVEVRDQANMISLRAGLTGAIMLRANADGQCKAEEVQKPSERALQFRHLSLIDLGRHYLSQIGCNDAFTLSKTKIAGMLLHPREMYEHLGRPIMLSESIGDFTNILRDAINKTLRPAYLDAPRTWPKFARRATAPDFKNIYRTALSEVPSFRLRPQGKGIDYVVLTDTGETYVLAEYALGVKLTRQALINDDLSAFSRIPLGEANAAARLEEDVAYTAVNSGPSMADGGAIFNATAVTTTGGHANLVGSGSGGAPSIAQYQATSTLMRVQKGPAGAARLNLQPKFGLFPVAMEGTVKQFFASVDLVSVVAAASAASSVPQGQKNPYFNAVEQIFNPRMDDVSTTAWKILADFREGQVDTLEVCFLEDEPEPVLKTQQDFDTDDLKFAGRHVVAAKVIDFRGMAMNYGS